jgi:hypothetical protein
MQNSRVQYDPPGLPPFPSAHLDYRDEPLSNFLPLLRTICILVILLESSRVWFMCVGFYPYLSGRASLPAGYPSPPVEYSLNAIPIGVDLFGIVAAVIVLGSASSLRVLVIWSWCQIVCSVLAMGFNAIYVLSHMAPANKQWAGYYVATELSELYNRLIAQVALPVMILVLRRLIRARPS